ncbi:DUF4421 domain-containing protein [Flavihumibacter fluvii]|uniref:DUF4421 domain-containing protein n=1 Tax=Flavihumibacter fluvii TaxID=2838157 RepID=UPI001BDE8FAE|nr:DUF4421 domain-containing protein [Flavihumibacter fluvii]ULQ53694.1 DUF4421 domain-containing protein [Flavihumibacter fluvii]
MYINRHIIWNVFFACLLLTLSFRGSAQQETSYIAGVDTNYIKTYPDQLPVRFFFSQKFTAIELGSSELVKNLRYRPNTTLNIGIGATYRMFTLNLAYGFPFMNQDKDKGETKYLDLQSHIYPRNWTIDFNGQLYKGYFLFPRGFANADPDKFYVRPDVGVSLFGITLYNMFNGARFSYKAGMVQTEWQQKSSGTFLIGGEIYGGSFSGDSALVPSMLKDQYSQKDVEKIRFFELGPGGGYAYTLVIKKHFFIMGSLTVNFDVGYSREYYPDKTKDQWSLRPNLLYRGVVGYNSRLWNLNLSLVGNQVAVRGASSTDLYYFRTGNLRLTLAKRVTPGPKLKKRLNVFGPNQ